MTVFRRTWVATALFTLIAALVWQGIVGWGGAWRYFLPAVVLSPPIWWIVVGRERRPRLWRGMVGGALTGYVTQSARDVPAVWHLIVHRQTGTAENQLGSAASFVVYVFIGACAITGGALIGLVAQVIQRRMNDGESA